MTEQPTTEQPTFPTRRGKAVEDTIRTSDVIEQVAEHAGVAYTQAADVIYAFLHYVKYAALATERKILLRNFGTINLTRTKGRVYGAHVGAPTYHPDRMKISLTSSLMEVDRWKRMQSIQKHVTSALDAALKPYNMDLAICAQIADLILSKPEVNLLRGQAKVEFLREWIYATGATPMIPAVTNRVDFNDEPYTQLKFRLRAEDRLLVIFDKVVPALSISAAIENRGNLAFVPGGWVSHQAVKRAISRQDPHKPLDQSAIVRFGNTVEDHCKSLYLAYKAAKYGAKPNEQEIRAISGQKDQSSSGKEESDDE